MTEQAFRISPLREVPPRPLERARLERRARLLAWGGNAWHLVEFGIALGAKSQRTTRPEKASIKLSAPKPTSAIEPAATPCG